ncbi:MAG: cupredoxin domain-containing protein [Candidatus Methylomirabilales bacterium]
MRYCRTSPVLCAWMLGIGLFGIMIAGTAWAAQQVKLNATEFAFRPSSASVEPGEVTFVVKNNGEYVHGFAIEGIRKNLPRIEPGETARLTVPLRKGTYTFYCPVKGHRGKGMEGALGAGVTPKAVEKAPVPAAPKKKRPAYY